MEVLNDLLGLDLKDLEWHHMVIRAVLVFIVALIYVRIAGMRAFGSHTPFDVVVTITMGAMLSRCISGHYPIVPLLSGAFTLAIVHRLTAHLTCRFKSLRILTQGKPVLLYSNGNFIDKNLNNNAISSADLDRALREQGLKEWSKVDSAWYETSGKISIVKKQ